MRPSVHRGLAILLAALLAASRLAGTALAQGPPAITTNCAAVNPVPRPCGGFTDVTTLTTIYFEVGVPSTNAAADALDPDSVTATLSWPAGGPEPMLLAGRAPAPGWSVTPNGPFVDGGRAGWGFLLARASPLDPATAYTVTLTAATLSGIPLDPAASSWTFTTRASLAGAALGFDVDLAQSPVRWPDRWWGGVVKPNFNTSVLFDQEPVYALLDEARADAPEMFRTQRDWPLMSDYWSGGGFFDGNPNLMREQETRRIVAIEDRATETVLTLGDLLEGPLYGIAPGRPLSGDYRAGDRVLVCDRGKSEAATVRAVDDAAGQVTLDLLVNAAATWVLDYPGSQPGDSPATPGHFSYPLGALRKLDPPGTPVYYWARLDDEWDRHVAHGRQPLVNFEAVPFDACRRGYGDAFGGSCPDIPKSWAEWDDIVRTVVRHVIDRYGPQVATWRYSVGNEPDLPIFWAATDDEFLSWYDHTTSSILRAFEDAGLDSSLVQIGGLEMTGIFPGFVSQILYHASPTAANPAPGFEERNHACLDPAFAPRLASRVRALCDATGGFGTPLDFVSTHSYERAADAATLVTDVKRRALAMDPVTFDRLRVMSHETTPDWIPRRDPVMSHETTPDWIPRRDPASRDMYRWGGYFSSWGADYFRRLLVAGEADARYLGGEATVTVWPFNTNFAGYTSIAGQLSIDTDGDGARDRVDAVPGPFFHFAHLAATMSHDVRSVGAVTDRGLVVSGWRSVEPLGDKFLLYSHDFRDTGGEETGGFDVTLRLTGVRFAQVDVTEYRFDRDHPARALLEALPDRGGAGVYSPAEVAAFEDAARLRPFSGPVRHDVTGGALQLTTRVGAQGVVFLSVSAPDADGDGIEDARDCAPLDPTNAPPGEVTGVLFLGDERTLTWDAVPGATGYDVLRETEWFGRAGLAPDASCVAPAIAATSWVDAATPGSGAWRYLVRARGCGAGTWGSASDGIERVPLQCP